jgi:hypothetical protein
MKHGPDSAAIRCIFPNEKVYSAQATRRWPSCYTRPIAKQVFDIVADKSRAKAIAALEAIVARLKK